MSATILRPCPVLDAVEAMKLRDSFKHVLEDGSASIILDLTGVQELAAAGLAAVTNLLVQGRRTGISIKVLMPEAGSDAATIIDQADVGRFLAPGGIWNALPAGRTGSTKPDGRSSWRARLSRHLDGALRAGGAPRAALTAARS